MDRDLPRLANNLATSFTVIESQFTTRSALPELAFLVLSSYAAWEEFSFRLVASSAYARPFRGDGSRVAPAPGISCVADFHSRLRSIKGWRSGVPAVHLGRPIEMVKYCKALRLSNEPQITPAVTSQHSPADSLRLIRNFLAHQNPGTATQVSLDAPSAKVEQRTVLAWLSEPQSGGRSRLGVWLSDLLDVARVATQ